MTGWQYYWRRYLGWFPVQFCIVCGKPYWGGLHRYYWRHPRGWWNAWMQEYCSKRCCDEEMDRVDKMYSC